VKCHRVVPAGPFGRLTDDSLYKTVSRYVDDASLQGGCRFNDSLPSLHELLDMRSWLKHVDELCDIISETPACKCEQPFLQWCTGKGICQGQGHVCGVSDSHDFCDLPALARKHIISMCHC